MAELIEITRPLSSKYTCDKCGGEKCGSSFQPSAIRDKNRQLVCWDCRRKKTPKVQPGIRWRKTSKAIFLKDYSSKPFAQAGLLTGWTNYGTLGRRAH